MIYDICVIQKTCMTVYLSYSLTFNEMMNQQTALSFVVSPTKGSALSDLQSRWLKTVLGRSPRVF